MYEAALAALYGLEDRLRCCVVGVLLAKMRLGLKGGDSVDSVDLDAIAAILFIYSLDLSHWDEASKWILLSSKQ